MCIQAIFRSTENIKTQWTNCFGVLVLLLLVLLSYEHLNVKNVPLSFLLLLLPLLLLWVVAYNHWQMVRMKRRK